jgi:hypothetical protein
LGEETDFHLTVEAEDAGSASRQAQMLERILLEECPSTRIRRVRSDTETMDGGATLALALASPVLVEVVKAIKAFLLQRQSSKIIITKGQTSFTVEGPADQHIKELLDFLRAEK